MSNNNELDPRQIDPGQFDTRQARIPERFRLQPLEDEPATLEASDGAYILRFLRETLQVILPAVILAVVVHLFLAQATVVFGQSMEPNLSPQQRLIVEKISYHLHEPYRNDIVVIDLPTMEDMLVKRVVGLPGEVISIANGQVSVNGTPLDESFPHDLDYNSMAPLRLGPNEYFVMGDNRDNSNDSRAFGPITRDEIAGRVWLRYWPLQELRLF